MDSFARNPLLRCCKLQLFGVFLNTHDLRLKGLLAAVHRLAKRSELSARSLDPVL